MIDRSSEHFSCSNNEEVSFQLANGFQKGEFRGVTWMSERNANRLWSAYIMLSDCPPVLYENFDVTWFSLEDDSVSVPGAFIKLIALEAGISPCRFVYDDSHIKNLTAAEWLDLTEAAKYYSDDKKIKGFLRNNKMEADVENVRATVCMLINKIMESSLV